MYAVSDHSIIIMINKVKLKRKEISTDFIKTHITTMQYSSNNQWKEKINKLY